MRRYFLRTLTVSTLSALALSVTVWAVSLMPAAQDQTPQDKAHTKSKTLRELAEERDVEIPDAEGESDIEFTGDLRTLTRGAHAIVLGRITKAEPAFIGDRYIATYFTVDVQRVLKETDLGEFRAFIEAKAPPAPLTTPLTVVRGGGVIHVNGHKASVNIKGRDLVTTNRDYVLFLEWSTAYKAFRIIGGVSGAVLVKDGVVQPLTSDGELKRRYKGVQLETFVSEVLLNKD